MVGLVLVSHSRALADALVHMARQVGGANLPIVGVGGVGPDGQALGTDATAIAQAIETLYTPDGVVVLMDLGSAVLSTDMALELLAADMRANIHRCAAPLVEGAVAAAVQIGLGNDAAQVCREALGALAAKADQLTDEDTEAVSPEQVPALPTRHVDVTIHTPHGLHARPAARLVNTAAAFDAHIQVAKLAPIADQGGEPAVICKGPVTARSLTALAGLGLRQGDRMRVLADGNQAEAALEAIAALVAHHFQASPVQTVNLPETCESSTIIAISPGMALGPAVCRQTTLPALPTYPAIDFESEWRRLQEAIDAAAAKIEQKRLGLEKGPNGQDAEIFDAHLLLLEDPELLDRVRRAIEDERLNAAQAWQAGIDSVLKRYQALEDAYLRQRAADVTDVAQAVLGQLLGVAPMAPNVIANAIVVLPELTPGWVAGLDATRVAGVVAARGGPTSHGAILLRNLDIPAIVAPVAAGRIQTGQQIGLDGVQGRLWIDPDAGIRDQLTRKRAHWQQQRRDMAIAGRQPAQTADGVAVVTAANVAGLDDAERARQTGAEGIGILRSEFLFAARPSAPTEREQIDMLRRIARQVAPHAVYVRTLDAGGDKPIAYLHMPVEANPFLGVRSTRLMLRRPDIFLAQLRAVLIAGVDLDVRIMFPMISTRDDLDQSLACLARAHRDLAAERIAHRWPIPTAMMVETPAAALLAPEFAAHIDFFSIGTNDLTQFTLAAERGHAELSAYADALHPAVLKLIQMVADAAHAQGKAVGVCGEVAADPVAIPILLGLGVDELSVNPVNIAMVRDCIRQVDRQAAMTLAQNALQTCRASSVRHLFAEWKSKQPKRDRGGQYACIA